MRIRLLLFFYLAMIVLCIATIDLPVLVAVQSVHPALRAASEFFAEAGLAKWYLWPSGVVTLGAGFVYWRTQNKTAYRVLYPSAQLFGALVVSGIAVHALKIIFARARPRMWLEQGQTAFFQWAEILAGHLSHYNSFPSGHSQLGMTLAVCGFVLLPPRLRAVSWLIAGFGVAVVISRVVLGVHYVSDVLAGALVGVGISWLFLSWYRRRFRAP